MASTADFNKRGLRPPQTQPPKVVILGAGNILLKDEGVGVRVVEQLRREYHFPENVSLIDGATLGVDLIPIIRDTEHLIIIDAVKARQKPGAILKFTPEELSSKIPAKHSLHQIGLLEALEIARQLDGKLPRTIIFGIVPEDASHMGLELTQLIRAQTPKVMKLIIEELTNLKIPAKKL